jgi:hypothetical protein
MKWRATDPTKQEPCLGRRFFDKLKGPPIQKPRVR